MTSSVCEDREILYRREAGSYKMVSRETWS